MTIILNGTTGITTPAITDVVTGNVTYTGALTGGAGVVNLGSGQLVKDAAGNLGLGFTPSVWGGYGNVQLYGGNGLALSGYDQSLGVNYYSNAPGAYKYTSTGPAVRQAMYNGQYIWNIAPSGTAGNPITFAQAMTLDASGNLLVGTTSSTNPNPGFSVCVAGAGNTQAIIGHSTSSGSGQGYVVFVYNSGSIGSITQSGTTAVLYNTTSDYRLKTVIGPVADAGRRIDSLQPVEYEWKADGARTRGFLAHQFQEVYAGSVTGEKDAVDEDGKPKYQAMQASSSEVIADLVAEIQSLRKRLTALENK